MRTSLRHGITKVRSADTRSKAVAFSRNVASLSFVFLALALPRSSQASPKCEDLFAFSVRKAVSSTHDPQILYGATERFDRERFESALRSYRSALSPSDRAKAPSPDSNEAKLALFEAIGEQQGYGLHLFRETLHSATPAQAKLIRKTLLGLKLDKGVRPAQIEEAFARLYLLNQSEPRSWSGLFSVGLPGKRVQLIQQRAELELGSRSLEDALERLGFMREPGMRDKASEWLRRHPMILEAPVKAALDILPLPTTFNHRPVNLLAARPLTPELRARLAREGFESLKPELESHYGKLPHWDLRWHYATKIVSYALMGYIASQMAPAMMDIVLPEDEVEPDASYIEFVQAIARYWTEVARAQITGDAKVDPESRRGKEMNDLLNSPIFDNGSAYDFNPEIGN